MTATIDLTTRTLEAPGVVLTYDVRRVDSPAPVLMLIGSPMGASGFVTLAGHFTDRTVVTGPVEATAIGNILMQSIGMKHLSSLADAREVVRTSFELEIYEPGRTADWDEAYSRLQKVIM